MKSISEKLYEHRKALVLAWLIALQVFYFFWVTPLDFLNAGPATGGDMGSHFFPLYTLVKVALPELSLRTWSPGNLMGEPQLLHYFPVPYLIMAVLSLFMPLGRAFNIGTLLPLFLVPFAVYYALRGLGMRRLVSAFASFASLFFFYNESYSMWGGNATSLLAGQFAHMYGLLFLFWFIGWMAREIRSGEMRYGPTLAIAAIACSHTYILLLVPCFFISFIFCFPFGEWKKKFTYCFVTGIWGILLSMWFVGPQILNAPWTTGNPMDWIFGNLWNEVFPLPFRIVAVVLMLSLPIYTYLLGAGKFKAKDFSRELGFWAIPTLACLGMFFVFPKLGLVDVRVVPQMLLFFVLYTAIVLVSSFRAFPKLIQYTLAIGLSIGCVIWVKKSIKNYSYWVTWNYSGWEVKPDWPYTRSVFDYLHKGFSYPRVANEHNPSLNQAGTTRVWEMLPYFAERGTMESLYQEAAFTAPYTYHLQALISEAPSCPIRGYRCPSPNLQEAAKYMQLFGVKDIILVSDRSKALADAEPALQKSYMAGPYSVYSLRADVPLVQVLQVPLVHMPLANFKPNFYDWVVNYSPASQMQIVQMGNKDIVQGNLSEAELSACHPQVNVNYNQIKLKTNCPGSLHMLKFTYHPSWDADTGDAIHMVSPGFMALTPSQNEVTLRFGHDFRWWAFGVISLLSFLLLFASYFGVEVRQKPGQKILSLFRRNRSEL